MNSANPQRILKHVNLLDTHVEIVIGVQRDGMPGAITINKRVKYVTTLTAAPEDLRPASTYGSDTEIQKLAFRSMTLSNISEQFMRTHLQRQLLGETLALAQGAALAQMKPGLLEQMQLSHVPAYDPRQMTAEVLYDRMVQVISTSYDSYDEFRANIEPLLEHASMIGGPSDDSGNGLNCFGKRLGTIVL